LFCASWIITGALKAKGGNDRMASTEKSIKKAGKGPAKGKRLKTIETPPAPEPKKPSGPPKLFLGTANRELQYQLMTQSWGAMGVTEEKVKKEMEHYVHRIHGAIAGVDPKNSVEGMLAVQMVGAHNMAMEFSRRAMHPEQRCDGVDANVARASQFMKVFMEQVACLQKLRGRGSQQSVRVEHVHVNQGGQAIVGTVAPGGEG
jgi:hypothetical protein